MAISQSSSSAGNPARSVAPCPVPKCKGTELGPVPPLPGCSPRAGGTGDFAGFHHRTEQSHGRPSDVVAAGLEALDSLNLGVALTDASAHLLLTNRTADQILATRDGLEVTAQGVIGTVKRCCSASLRVGIEQAAQTALSEQPCLKNTALIVERASGKRPLTVFLRSVQGMSSPPNAAGTVLLFMLDPEGPVQATEASLRQLYGLTAREACVAHLLISGKTFEECCDYLSIRASTARMHLGNVFAKTGVQRQGQLISLLLKSVGAVRMASADKIRSRAEQHADPGDLRDDRSKARPPAVLAAGLEALDSLHIGVGVMNGLSQLLFANQTAHQILAARDGLEVTAQGILTAVKKSGFPSVSALTQQAAQSRLRK